MSYPYPYPTTTTTAATAATTAATAAIARSSSASYFAHHITTTASNTPAAAPLLFYSTTASLKQDNRARMNHHHEYNSHDQYHRYSNMDEAAGSQWLEHHNEEEDIFLQLLPAQINNTFQDTSSTLFHLHQHQTHQHTQLLEHGQVEEQQDRQTSSGTHSLHSFDDFNSPTSSYYSAHTERSPFHHPDGSSVYPFTFGYPYDSHPLPTSSSSQIASINSATPIQYYNTPATQQWDLTDSPYQALLASYEAIRDPQSGLHSAGSSTSSCHHHDPLVVGITTCSSLPASNSLSPASTSSTPSSSSTRRLDTILPSLEMTDTEGRSVKRLRSKSDDVREGIPACDFCRKRKVKCDRKRPTCSFCARHGQQCRTEDRLRKRGPPTKAQREEMRRMGLVYDRHKRQWLPTKTQE